MADFVKVATTGELAPGQGKIVEVQGKEIALFIAGVRRRHQLSRARVRR